MTRHPTLAGVRFETEADVLLPEDGYADADVTVAWAPELHDGVRIAAPDGVEVSLSPEGHAVTIREERQDVLRRSWQLKQAAPIVAAYLSRLCLHASCVRIDGHVTAFVGASETGKSTLAWHLVKRGHELVADDLLPIRFGEAPSIPGTHGGSLARVFFLSRASDVLSTAPLTGSDAVALHIENGFGEHGHPATWAFQFDAYATLAETVPHASLVIPDDRSRLDEVESALRIGHEAVIG